MYFTRKDEDITFSGGLTELWKTNGTPEGTQLVTTNLDQSITSFLLETSIDFNNNLIFKATNADSNSQSLWISDGTENGTQLIKEFERSIENINIRIESNYLTATNDNFFFLVSSPAFADGGFINARLWVSDGTENGTRFVREVERPDDDGFIGTENLLFFLNDDGIHGQELWISDGTEDGTRLVKDIRPEERIEGTPVNNGSNISNLTVVNNTLFFTANDGVNGQELWISDGTEDGTRLVKNITPEDTSSVGSAGNTVFPDGPINGSFEDSGSLVVNSQRNFTNIDGILYFLTGTSSNSQIWQSDGTEEGTFQIEPEQISIGEDEFVPSFVNPKVIVEINNQPYFFAEEAYDSTEERLVNESLLSISNTNEAIDNGSSESGNENEDITGDTVYRFFNTNSGVHFYTANEAERDAVRELSNFNFEGGSYLGVDPLTGQPEPVPVYRFLNQDTGVHLYTISETERDVVGELDNFSFEGEAFFAYESEVEGSIPIYRFFNSTSGAHFYTPSAGERDNVEANLPDFQSEGIAYYALPLPE